MLKFRNSPFEDDIEKATHENNLTEDWSLIMHICDNATNFQDGAKYCLKAIMKRLYHHVPRVVLQTLTLLDACVKNCDRRLLLQVASSDFTNEVRKLLPKMHPSSANKLKELLQRWSLEEFKDDPELCIIPSLYYKLKSEGVEFPPYEKETKKTPTLCTNPDGVSSQEEENDIIKAIEISLKDTGRYEVPIEYRNIAAPSKSLPEPFKVRAVYDFDAAEDNELTIKIGEIVLVLDNSNTSWWKGSNHRGEGLFPSNFVTEDLNSQPEEPEIPEATKTETVQEVAEEEVKLDEAKIDNLIKWLNDTDPTEEATDPEELLVLERQCCSMAPIIEENLQAIDNRLAMLNLVNEKIMAAFDLFHSLSDHMASLSQPLKYYPGTLNQHVIQFPHPQVTAPHGSLLHQVIPPPVPQELLPMPTSIPQSSNQINHLPVSTVQSCSISTVSQELPLPSNTNAITTPVQGVTEVNQPINSTSSTSTTASLPYSQANSVCNFNIVGGYCVPQQAIPYPVQYGPSVQQPGCVQSSVSVANVMPVPYGVPSMSHYFPVQYYYVNSNPATQNVTQTTTSTSTVVTQASDQKTTMSTTASEVTAINSSIPVTSNYLSDLHNLYINTSNSNDNKTEKSEVNPEKEAMNDQQPVSSASES